MVHKFEAILRRSGDMDAAYVVVPVDIRAVYGKGRLAVRATFDGVPYDGQVVRMGTPDYLIGVLLDGSAPDETVRQLLDISYDMTKGKI